MSDKQIRQFSSCILISDVISYIDTHKKEYEKFLKAERQSLKPKKGGKK